MRHAVITITNSPHGFGGVSTWIERMTLLLPRYGWRVTTVTHALDQEHVADWMGKHPNIELKPILGRFARLNEIEPTLEAYLEAERPDAVIVSCSYWMAPTIQRWKLRGEAVRMIGVVHADSNAYYDGLAFYKDCFDHVIGVSQTCYDKLLALGYPASLTSLLPYGVPCDSEAPSRTYHGPLKLAYVGRLVQEQKRIFDFVPLMSALNARKVDYRLDFYGAGADEAALQRRVEAVDTAGRVTFHGWVPAEQVVTAVWPKADVFVLLSDYEGLSISMLEAMGQGVVPVVSRVESGAGEVIREGETGLSFPIGDIEACAEGIASLDRERERMAAMSLAAWSLVRERFSVDGHAKRLAEILDATLDQPARLGVAPYMGPTARPIARLFPGWAIVRARRLLKRGDPANEGYTTFP